LRFKGEYIYTDSSFFSILVGSGIIGGVLLLLIYIYGFKYLFTLFTTGPKDDIYRGMLSFYLMLLITSIFGINLTFYTLSFFFWMTLGWISKEYITNQEKINE